MLMIILLCDISHDHLTIRPLASAAFTLTIQRVDLSIFNTADPSFPHPSWRKPRAERRVEQRAEQVSDLTSIRANCSGDNKMRVGHRGQSDRRGQDLIITAGSLNFHNTRALK